MNGTHCQTCGTSHNVSGRTERCYHCEKIEEGLPLYLRSVNGRTFVDNLLRHAYQDEFDEIMDEYYKDKNSPSDD